MKRRQLELREEAWLEWQEVLSTTIWRSKAWVSVSTKRCWLPWNT